jgi:hypothetical protein
MEERVKPPVMEKVVQRVEKHKGPSKPVADDENEDEETKTVTSQLPSPENAISDLPTRDVTIELLNEAAEINERKTADEARMKEIKEQLINIAQAFELPGVKTNRCGFMYLGMRSKRTLDKKLLIENGVSPEVIKESYKESKPYADARFVPVK